MFPFLAVITNGYIYKSQQAISNVTKWVEQSLNNFPQWKHDCSTHTYAVFTQMSEMWCATNNYKFKNTFRAPAISVSSQNTKHTRTLYTSYAPSAPLKQNFFICEPFVSRLNVAKQRGKLIFFCTLLGGNVPQQAFCKILSKPWTIKLCFSHHFPFAFMPME